MNSHPTRDRQPSAGLGAGHDDPSAHPVRDPGRERELRRERPDRAEPGSAEPGKAEPGNRDRADRRQDRRAELSALVRRYQRETDHFDQAVADRLGVNRTDLRCLDIMVEDAGAGRRSTPTDLAARSGMSPSAITTVLDRLERAGYARRVRDEVNRRRVTVALTPLLGKLVEEIFTPVAVAGAAHLASYTDQELEVLVRFFTRSDELRAEQIRALQGVGPSDGIGAGRHPSGCDAAG